MCSTSGAGGGCCCRRKIACSCLGSWECQCKLGAMFWTGPSTITCSQRHQQVSLGHQNTKRSTSRILWEQNMLLVPSPIQVMSVLLCFSYSLILCFSASLPLYTLLLQPPASGLQQQLQLRSLQRNGCKAGSGASG